METNQTLCVSLLVLASLCPLPTLWRGGVTSQFETACIWLSLFEVSVCLE